MLNRLYGAHDCSGQVPASWLRHAITAVGHISLGDASASLWALTKDVRTCGGKAEEPTAETSDDESGAVMRSQRESLHAMCVCRVVAAHAEHGLTAYSAQVGNLGGT